jgi:hypothetical protein
MEENGRKKQREGRKRPLKKWRDNFNTYKRNFK